jgi:hypothetical protein
MSLLSMTQMLAAEFGIPSPGLAASSTDLNIQQIVAFINKSGRQIGKRADWQELRVESNFLTLAAQPQGAIATLAPGYKFWNNETMWNRTQRRPIFGPKSPAEWQQLQAQFMQGPWQQYIISGGQLIFLPAPPAGQSVYFYYASVNWATDITGTIGKTAMNADTDVAKIDEDIIYLDALWRFKAAKKLTWDADFETAEAAIDDAITRNATKPKLNLAGQGQDTINPAVLVPAGSWPIAGEPS